MHIKIYLPIIFVFSILLMSCSDNSTTSNLKPVETQEQKEAKKQEMRKHYDDLVSNLQKIELLKEYKQEGKIIVYYVNTRPWKNTPFEQKKKLMHLLSEFQETSGYTPWVEIKDYYSGKLYGAIKPPLTNDIYE